MNPRKLGDFGERIACYYLENKGHRILEKNYSRKWLGGPQKGEIDIIVEKDEIISFIEVKTLRQTQDRQKTFVKNKGFLPEDKVNFQKQKQLTKMAQDWLSENKIPLESKWQIDVISIKVDFKSEKAKIRHFKNAVC